MTTHNYEGVLNASQNTEWFKEKSLELLAQQLADKPYPNYPEQDQRLFNDDPAEARRLIRLPGTWWTEKPYEQAVTLHPWFDDMVRNRNIGALAGKGFYWELEANETADPIITRHDLDEPWVLMVVRGDTGKIALPGGFVNKNENPYIAAIREAGEETGFDLLQHLYASRKVYEGPLADLRVTAHAWPLTHAYRFTLDPETTKGLPTEFTKGFDDATEQGWMRYSEIMNRDDVHGSHKLLIELAFREKSFLERLDNTGTKNELYLG